MSFAAYQLYLDYQPSPSFEEDIYERDAVGTIKEINQNVKRKTSDSLMWNPISKGDAVFNGDSLRTGLSSYTSIELSDKSLIELEENSLVVLDSSEKSFNIDFKTGELRSAGTSANLNVKIGSNLLKANKAGLSIRKSSKEDTSIQVVAGQASLFDSKGKKIDLNKTNTAKIDASGRAEPIRVEVLLRTPEHRTNVLNSKDKIMYPFTWQYLGASKAKQFFEVSSNPLFLNSTSYKRRASGAVEAPILKGQNYWRVGWSAKHPSSKRTIIKYTTPRLINLGNDDRIQLVSPENTSSFRLQPGNAKVDFRWRSKNPAKLYLFELSKSSDFRQIKINRRLALSELTINDLESGTYFWRVSAFGENNKDMGQSRSQAFSVERSIPKAPRLSYPRDNFTWTMPESLRFEWEQFPNKSYYQWVLSKKSDHSLIIKTKRLEESSTDWQWTESGLYFWKVKVFSSSNQLIAESFTYQFNIDPNKNLSAIELLKPLDQSEVVIENIAPFDPIEFEWRSKESLRHPFELVVSRNASFTDPKVYQSAEQSRLKVNLEEEGIYYWKVKWFAPNNSENKRESILRSFRLSKNKNLPAPILLEPASNQVIDIFREDFVSFEWEPRPNVKQYRFILKRMLSENSYKTIVDKTLDSNEFEKNRLVPGSYQFQVYALDEKGVSGLSSEVRRFDIQRNRGLAPPIINPAIVK